ncbi:hypothetical protein LEP1GSC151_1597 [Leptospira interrogans serovar Grippotyphosa str. LT2186]|uniref:Uncharacterized protein n=1 Tax=Leptospira interrogans serovar Grippotyphosa str. LT2186 TaxID=1001599 RepID=M3HKP2_LEPIR|nr:hypothetical protein LEP1GSC151_1597 [Leptospira interrogans serovar Grippotyphosa str. LT2186]
MEDLCSFKIWLSFFIYLEPKIYNYLPKSIYVKKIEYTILGIF